ncbi:MAG: KEOPS complex subunit Pcc1 [Candidatus Micrarchaeota archaeon]|nr:KEOPS complex subunit Pcc1 [Candidatus Micrarchaeota archaeon]
MKELSLSAEIRVKGKKKNLLAIKDSILETRTDRMKSLVVISKDGKELTIRVDADDATALRAGLNTFLRILQSIYDLEV